MRDCSLTARASCVELTVREAFARCEHSINVIRKASMPSLLICCVLITSSPRYVQIGMAVWAAEILDIAVDEIVPLY
jgi:hypothetical protein